MKCEQFIAEVDEIAVNDPSVSLTSELCKHLDCEHCREHSRELVDSWLLLAGALDRFPVHKELEGRVMRQIAIARARTAGTTIFHICKYALAVCVLVALATGTLTTANWFGAGWQGEEDLAKVKDLARQMGRIKELERAFSNPRIKYVSLTSVSNRVGGYLVHDFITNEAHFFCFNLPTTRKTLKLWLLDKDGGVIATQTVEASTTGLGASLVRIRADSAAIHEVVVAERRSGTDASPPETGILRVAVGS